MGYKMILLIFSLAIPFLLAPSLFAANSASNSIGVSLTIEAYIKCTVDGDTMTVMTNSYQPVSILEDSKILPEKAVFGRLATFTIKNNSTYTILSEI